MSLCDTSTLPETSALALRQPVGALSDRAQPDACGLAHVAEEVPVGFIYNGFPHAVMMATPADLEDFAIGFSLTEGIIDNASGVRGLSVRRTEDGIELTIELAPPALNGFLRRRRVRALRGHTSCGVCGVEEISQISQPSRRPSAPSRMSRPPLDPDAIERAMAAVRDHQPLSRMTHCAHAAARADADGALTLVREDIGRHNALDKLIGASLRAGIDPSAGFCLVTSRCSFEMVQKAIAGRIAVLVAISAPTALAIRTACDAGILLVIPDRDRRLVIYGGHG
jgi:FdhD protein